MVVNPLPKKSLRTVLDLITEIKTASCPPYFTHLVLEIVVLHVTVLQTGFITLLFNIGMVI